MSKWSKAQIDAASRGVIIARTACKRYIYNGPWQDDRMHYYSISLQYYLVTFSLTVSTTFDTVKARDLRKKAEHLRRLQKLRNDRKKVLREVSILPEVLIQHVIRYVGW